MDPRSRRAGVRGSEHRRPTVAELERRSQDRRNLLVVVLMALATSIQINV